MNGTKGARKGSSKRSKENPPAARSKDGPSDDHPKGAQTFPWVHHFTKHCQAHIGLKSLDTLETLMNQLINYLSSTVGVCYGRPNRATKLKKTINNHLLFFHMIYSDIKKPLINLSYLNKMSDLMAVYLDMEFEASRRCKESLPKIVTKLISSLYLYLDCSQDHILDSVLKTKYMNQKYWELSVPILSHVVRDQPDREIYEMTYVRYILVFKMLKQVLGCPEEKKKVDKFACAKLIPPPHFREKLQAGLLRTVLPEITKSKSDITAFLMQAKFCVKEKAKAFFRAVDDPKQYVEFDKLLFFDDGESSIVSSCDEQEIPNGSNLLINDIWSSMSPDSDIRTQIRLTNVTVSKSQGSHFPFNLSNWKLMSTGRIKKKQQKSKEKSLRKAPIKVKASSVPPAGAADEAGPSFWSPTPSQNHYTNPMVGQLFSQPLVDQSPVDLETGYTSESEQEEPLNCHKPSIKVEENLSDNGVSEDTKDINPMSIELSNISNEREAKHELIDQMIKSLHERVRLLKNIQESIGDKVKTEPQEPMTSLPLKKRKVFNNEETSPPCPQLEGPKLESNVFLDQPPLHCPHSLLKGVSGNAKFKTPAQLKQGYPTPFPDLNAALDQINVAQSVSLNYPGATVSNIPKKKTSRSRHRPKSEKSQSKKMKQMP